MKGAPRVFGAIACGPVLDLNGETLTFILDRGWQVMGLASLVHRSPFTAPSTASLPAHIPSKVVASWHSMQRLTARAQG